MYEIFPSFLFLLACSVHASVTSAPAVQTTSGATISNATCPFRTVNYITHGLPQQCLTSSWRSGSPSLTAISTEEALLTTLATPTSASNVSLSALLGSENSTASSDDPAESPIGDSTARLSPPGPESSASSFTPLPSTAADLDDPSPLEDEKFMSFEEWKKQNLQKAGQSEHVGRDIKPEQQVPRKRPANIHTALDSLGDDAEIDLDFSGFLPGGPELTSPEQPKEDGDREVDGGPSPNSSPNLSSRSKDAGTTCKERYNYASFDCAASVRKHNPEGMSASAVLGENKDSYMLNVCSAENKFLILELCNDISIDTIVLGNFEFFSSIFRTFRVSVSDKYPVKMDKWRPLGTFEARNTREIQAFLVENPVIWARYVRIEFLTHYGSEYYCPVSLVRVHGKTMMEEYKHDLETLQADDDDTAEDTSEPLEAAGEALIPEAIADVILNEKERQSADLDHGVTTESLQQKLGRENGTSAMSDSVEASTLVSTHQFPVTNGDTDKSLPRSTARNTGLSHAPLVDICPIPGLSREASVATSESSISTPSRTSSTASVEQAIADRSESEEELKKKARLGYKTPIRRTSENTTTSSFPIPQQRSHNSTDSSQSSPNATLSDRPRSSSSTTQGQAAAPTMQESFFKSVQKRLQMLESNSSLSLQYIEDQSRALRDAFNRVEQRQLAKTSTFLDYLNTTVLSELRDFRQQYDQLWQSTVIELQIQRERYQQETAAINVRLGVLADELIFQKRVSILQMMLILICLGIVLFTKGHLNQYLEIPVVQRVLSRSPSSRWLNMASLDTPTQSPPPTREGSLWKRQGILKGHRRMHSEDSIEGSLSPQEMYSPPTPISVGDFSDGEIIKEEKRLDDPEFDPSSIERPSTSPPMLPSSATPSTPELNGMGGFDMDTIETRLLNSSPDRDAGVPRVVVEEATPPPKHLTWDLPDS